MYIFLINYFKDFLLTFIIIFTYFVTAALYPLSVENLRMASEVIQPDSATGSRSSHSSQSSGAEEYVNLPAAYGRSVLTEEEIESINVSMEPRI